MSKLGCESCGQYDVPIIRHHIDGRKNSDRIVSICPNCHYECHHASLWVDNEASRNAASELEELSKHKKWISPKDVKDALSRNGYNKYFDGEEEWLREEGYIT